MMSLDAVSSSLLPLRYQFRFPAATVLALPLTVIGHRTAGAPIRANRLTRGLLSGHMTSATQFAIAQFGGLDRGVSASGGITDNGRQQRVISLGPAANASSRRRRSRAVRRRTFVCRQRHLKTLDEGAVGEARPA